MQRSSGVILGSVLLPLLIIAGACSSNVPSTRTAAPTTESVPTTPAPTTAAPTTTTTVPTTTTTIDPVALAVEAELAAMTLDQKIGQLLMPVVQGTNAFDVNGSEAARNNKLAGFASPAEIVSAYQLGGLMYLGPNVESPAQIGAFSTELQGVAAEAGLPPLLISADQEGGRVRRVRGDGVTAVGSARSLAGDPVAVQLAGETTARELAALGINMVLAPVADVARFQGGVIGDRSYGADPVLVSDMVSASIDGLQAGGAAAVAKHWPGHGNTAVDSHKSLPVINAGVDEWASIDRVPFEAALGVGVDALMVGHLAMPSLDPAGEPATVSPILVEQMLREDLLFDGVLMTDALDMHAVDRYAEDELAVRVIEAGIDILLVPPDLEAARNGLLNALASGRLTEDRLDTSVRRVLTLKAELGLLVSQP